MGYYPLRGSESIYQLVSIRFNLTRCLSLGPAFTFFFIYIAGRADIISPQREECYDENGVPATLEEMELTQPRTDLNMMSSSSLDFTVYLTFHIIYFNVSGFHFGFNKTEYSNVKDHMMHFGRQGKVKDQCHQWQINNKETWTTLIMRKPHM